MLKQTVLAALMAATDASGLLAAITPQAAPAATDNQAPPEIPDHGRVSHVVTAKGDPVKTAFQLVEAAALIPSNSLDGRINAGYPQELQPRDRTRQSSVLQIAKLSRNLQPARLADSGLSSHGAPIIGPDKAVESGNGRVMGILKAYAEGNADKYRQYLEDNAELYGFTPAQVKAMERPVLVRLRLDAVDRVKFAKDSNLSDLQGMSPTELARVDAEAIDERLMGLFAPSEGGDLLAASNRPFVAAFMESLGAEQAASYTTADGRPTKQMIDRIQGAIFAKAYQNDLLLQLATEEPDPEIRNILTALNVAAPAFVEMRYLSGEAHKQTTDRIGEGVGLLAGEPTDKPINVDEKYPPRPDPVTAPALDLAALATATKEEVIAGLHPGVRYKPNMRATAEAGITSGVINLGDEFFTRPAELREGTLIHELSHYDAANIGEQVAIDMAQAGYFGPMNGGTVANGPNGQFIPDECLTETIALYKQGEHTYLKERYPKAFEVAQSYMQTGKIARGLLVDIAAGAKAYQDEIKAADAKIELAKIVLKKRHEVEPEGPEKERIGQIFTNVWITGEITPEAQTLLDEEAAKVPPVPASSTLDKQALAALVDAATVIREAKASGQDVGEYLSQMGLFGDIDPAAAALAKFIAANNRSAKRMGAAFKALAEEINAELQHQGAAAADMFGAPPLDLFAVLARVDDRMAAEGGGKGGTQMSMFEGLGPAMGRIDAVTDTLIMTTSTKGLLAALDFQLHPNPRSKEAIEPLLKPTITALRRAKTLPELSGAIEAYDAAMKVCQSRQGAMRLWDMEGLVDELWFPGLFGQLKTPYIFQVGVAARQRELVMQANELREQRAPGASRQLAELGERFKKLPTDYPLDRMILLEWVSNNTIKWPVSQELFVPVELDELAADQAEYRKQIEAHTYTLDPRDQLSLKAGELFDFEAIHAALKSEQAFKALAPDDVQGAARYLSWLKDKYAKEEGADLKYIKEAASDWYWQDMTPERKKAANRMISVYYRKAREIRESGWSGAEGLIKEVDRLIAGSPLNQRQAAERVGQCNIRITSVRLVNGWSKDALKHDIGQMFRLVGGATKPFEMVYKKDRAHASSTGYINSGANLDKSTLWHEMGHMVEFDNPELLALAKKLMQARHDAIPEGETRVLPLQILQPTHNYDADEYAINDHFADPYTGKIYRGDKRIDMVTCTEVFSMGFEALSNPAKMARLAAKDPEHLALTLAAVKYLQKKGAV